MKPIELTQEHKDKLLKMCKTLFPEYELVSYDEKFDDLDNGLIRFKTKTGVYKSFTFHWFEFCMTHLWIKIQAKNHKSSKELMQMYNAYWDITNRFLHLIDYLYEKFKKLNL